MLRSMFPEEHICANCGEKIETEVLACALSCGPSDLDGRPDFPARYDLIEKCVTCCPVCGYCGTDIERPVGNLSGYLKSEEYLTCEDHKFSSSDTVKYYRSALLCLKREEYSKAFYAFLDAAWTCDDENDTENAAMCRRKALAVYDSYREEDEWKPDTELIVIDLLRRTEQFLPAIRKAREYKTMDSFKQRILDYQITLSQNKDSGCHNADI